MSRPILVTGATGRQGGAVLESLAKLQNDAFVIIALTRNAASPAAQRIASKLTKVHVLQGNMDEPETIFSEAQKVVGMPIWGVFMVQSVLVEGVTGAQEEVQGKNFIDSCVAHNVKSLVYTSVDRGGSEKSANDPTPVSVWASKHRIEQHLAQAASKSDISWLVLRPTGFFEALLTDDMMGKLLRTNWKVLINPEQRCQYVSCKDIAFFAVQGFLEPEKWSGNYLSLAGWEGTYDEANQVNKKVNGKNFSLTFGLLVRFVFNFVVKDIALTNAWMNEKGFGADIEHLRRLHPGLASLEDYLWEQKRVGK